MTDAKQKQILKWKRGRRSPLSAATATKPVARHLDCNPEDGEKAKKGLGPQEDQGSPLPCGAAGGQGAAESSASPGTGAEPADKGMPQPDVHVGASPVPVSLLGKVVAGNMHARLSCLGHLVVAPNFSIGTSTSVRLPCSRTSCTGGARHARYFIPGVPEGLRNMRLRSINPPLEMSRWRWIIICK